jgi:hypothetical protein
MFNAQPRNPFCVFCGKDKGHTKRICHHTIHKKMEIAASAAQTFQLKDIQYIFVLLTLHSTLCPTSGPSLWSPSASFIPEPPLYGQISCWSSSQVPITSYATREKGCLRSLYGQQYGPRDNIYTEIPKGLGKQTQSYQNTLLAILTSLYYVILCNNVLSPSSAMTEQ